jgi:hypothetical protein
VIIGDDRPGPLTDPTRALLLLTHEPGVWAHLSRAYGRRLAGLTTLA